MSERTDFENIPLEDYQLRVLQEYRELSTKVKKLDQFLGCVEFNRVSLNQQYLLRQQFFHMKEYEKILKSRLKEFGVSIQDEEVHTSS